MYFLRPYLDPIARRAASRQRLCAHRVSPFTPRRRCPPLPSGRHWSGATPGSHCHYVPASVTSAISFGSSLPPIRLTRRDTGPRNEIMSAVRGLRSSERDHVAPGRSLMVESRCGAVALGRTYLLPPLSSGGASMVPPWLRFHIPLIGRVEGWRAGRPLDRATFPVPSTSHAACGFPALRAPICFTPPLMGPILLGQLSARRVALDRR